MKLLQCCSAVFRLLQRSFSSKWHPQKNECCSATSAAQHSKNCSATSVFACGMLQGWGLEGWGLGLAEPKDLEKVLGGPALSAPSVTIFLRLRLWFSDAGGKSQRCLGPKMSFPSGSLAIFPCDGKLLAIAILLEIPQGIMRPHGHSISDGYFFLSGAKKEPQSQKIAGHEPLKQGFWGKSHQKVHPKVRRNLCRKSPLGYLFCPTDFTTENRGDLQLRVLVLLGPGATRRSTRKWSRCSLGFEENSFCPIYFLVVAKDCRRDTQQSIFSLPHSEKRSCRGHSLTRQQQDTIWGKFCHISLCILIGIPGFPPPPKKREKR